MSYMISFASHGVFTETLDNINNCYGLWRKQHFVHTLL